MESQGKISYFAAVLMSINIMVGAGILYAVGPMTATAGTISFLGWPLIGLMLFPVIWCVVKASQIFPGEGGFYHYGSSGIGPMAGFLAQWGYLLGYLGTAASVATVLRIGLGEATGSALIRDYPILFNLLLAALYTGVNLIALEKFSKIQSVATLLKITPILIVISLIVFYFNPSLTLDLSSISKISMSVSTVMFAYWGFEACCNIGGLLKDGPQKVGSVILVGFFATMSLYMLFHMGLLYIMGAESLAQYGAIGFPRFLGLSPLVESAMLVGITGAILFSWANSILGISLGNITNINFMAKKKLILGDQILTQVNGSNRPTYAAILHGVILFAIITFITDVDVLFALTNFGVILAFLITILSVFNVNFKSRDYKQMAVTTLGLISCCGLIYYSWIKLPSALYLIPLAIGIAGGVLMYKMQCWREEKKALPAQVLE